MKAVTVKRNALVVGHNSKSYDEKHPEHLIVLKPIRQAKKALKLPKEPTKAQKLALKAVKELGGFSKPTMLRTIHVITRSVGRGM